ncbi:MAG TPA: NUDIX hydrolase [Fibrobacteraceae bacterium]|nr:NUDIX hydrolase [Fibrobacteraceae bacterium]
MPYTFSLEIPEADQPLILQSPLFCNWLVSLQRNYVVSSLHFASADFFSHHEQRRLLFLKLKVQVSNVDGKNLSRVVVLRGNAVAVMVVLWCEGKPYQLLVDQARFPIGAIHHLEIVAGILDWSQDWRKVALAELDEEAGLEVADSELIDLSQVSGIGGADGFTTSCGLLDERVHLVALERTVAREELERLDGRGQTYVDEDEGIRTIVLPYFEALQRCTDTKGLCAAFLYERWCAGQGRPIC